MTKSKWIRIMSLMLILTMFSSVYMSSTIARFSDTVQSSDNTRVAIWDINGNEVTMELFKTSYTDDETGNTIASSYNTDKIIAPGTSGTSQFSIVNHKGDIAPEVMYYIQIDLDDSQVSNDIITNQYIQWKLDNGQWGTWDDLKVSLYSLSGSPSGIKTYQAGVLADAFKKNITHSISWQWLEDDIDVNTMTDDIDYTAEIVVKVIAKQTSTVYADAVEGSNLIVNVVDEIEPVVVKSSAPMNELVEVQVNGEVIERDVDYTVTEGSTIITLTETYLKTLPVGNYNISVVSQKQVATAKLDVVDRVYNTPNTDGNISSGIVHDGIIPEGGTYYTNNPIFDNELCWVDGYWKYEYETEEEFMACNVNLSSDELDGYETVLTAGDEFPIPKTGDVYIYGDYEYRYNMSSSDCIWYVDDYDDEDGWEAKVLTFKNKYGNLLTTIAGENLISLCETFAYSPIEVAPIIPNTVKYMTMTFDNCKNLIQPPVIPNSVISISAAFRECDSLETAPVIPENVEDMEMAFFYCDNLTGEIEINAILDMDYEFACDNIFVGTVKSIILIGTSPYLNEIAATANNGNVSVRNGVIGGDDELVVSSILSENSWETISAVAKSGKAADYWSVGDETTVKVNGAEKKVVIADFDHDGENTVTFVFIEDVVTAGMNDTAANSGSWKESKMRTVIMPEILNQMENKDLIKEVAKKTIKGGYDACSLWDEEHDYCENVDLEKAYELVTTNDKLFLLSYTEVFGDNEDWDWDTFNEGTQYEYFKTVKNRIIEPDENGTGKRWRLRTPNGEFVDIFYGVDDYYGDVIDCFYYDDYSVVPAFVIG